MGFTWSTHDTYLTLLAKRFPSPEGFFSKQRGIMVLERICKTCNERITVVSATIATIRKS